MGINLIGPVREMQKISRIILIVLILMLGFGCQKKESNPSKDQHFLQIKNEKGDKSKKIIFLMIDSLMSQSIDEGIKQGVLPTFQFLIEHGQYYKDMVSSFPTMSVTIDSSLVTGDYPNGHQIPGLTWYSAEEKKVINYGTGPMEVLRYGVDPVMADVLIHLNGKHLNPKVPTIFEELAHRGQKTGAINGLIYRGAADQTLSIPTWIQDPTSLPKEIKVKGPDFFALGSLSNPLRGVKKLSEGITSRMGFNNKYSIEMLQYLIKENRLPDFLYVYLPDMDQRLHKKGPADLKGLKEVDAQLHSVLQAFGSPQEALDKAVFILSGDSGMTQILSSKENPVIDLPSLLKDYRVLRTGNTVTDEAEIILAVNETMAYVYKHQTGKTLRQIAESLAADPRIDFISWKEKEWIYAVQGQTAKELRYKANGELTDPYRQKWTVEGNFGVLDLKTNPPEKLLTYGQYPDAMQRLSSALNSHQGEFLVVTAKPGYELADKSSPKHKGGGGHGSLHQQESLVPLIITGTNEKPQYLRMIDLKPFIMKLLK